MLDWTRKSNAHGTLIYPNTVHTFDDQFYISARNLFFDTYLYTKFDLLYTSHIICGLF